MKDTGFTIYTNQYSDPLREVADGHNLQVLTVP